MRTSRLATALLSLFILSAIGTTEARGQTTDTERAAARGILAEINDLQLRLDPAGMAKRLAERTDTDRDAIVSRTTEL